MLIVISTFNGTHSLQSGSQGFRDKTWLQCALFLREWFFFPPFNRMKLPLLKKQEYAKAMLMHQQKQSVNFPMNHLNSIFGLRFSRTCSVLDSATCAVLCPYLLRVFLGTMRRVHPIHPPSLDLVDISPSMQLMFSPISCNVVSFVLEILKFRLSIPGHLNW